MLNNMIPLPPRLSAETRQDISALWRIAYPIMIQSAATTAVNLLDALMVGALGDAALTAVNIHTQFFSRLFHVILFGLGSGGSVFIAQYWGIRDKKTIHRIMGVLLTIGASLGALFFTGVALIPDRIIRFYTNDPAVIRMAGEFLRFQAPVFLFYPVTMVFSAGNRSTGFTRIPMLTGTSAFLVNLSLNYVLIFGKLGAPALGTKGAAIATMISRFVEITLMIALTFRFGTPAAAKIREYFVFRRALVVKVLKKSLPVLINETLWGSGVNVYYSLFAQISTVAAAAAAAVSPIDALLFITICALGDACAVLIGNELGRGGIAHARRLADLARWLNGTSAALLGLVLFLVRDRILSFYALSPEALKAASGLLMICALSVPIRALGYTMMIGILRSGGDVIFCMLADSLSIWLAGIPTTALLTHGFHFPITVVYLGMAAEWVTTATVCTFRVRSGKWANVLTGELPTENAALS